MAAETEEDYLWAVQLVARVLEQFGVIPSTIFTDRELDLMNSLDNVFPDADFLLCRWHIDKNITAKHRLSFDSMEAFQELLKQWNALVFSNTVACYEQQLEAMQEMFPLHVMAYLETTWLVYKERFVACFLRGKLHFGHTTTSSVESAHLALKKWISVFTGDLLRVDSACRLACDGQFATIKHQTAIEHK